MGVWEYGGMGVWKYNFLCEKIILLKTNKSKFGSMGVWGYGKLFPNDKDIINTSLKPFIHACFSR